jgi:hypothetical protein
MVEYYVRWEIDIAASSPEEAAKRCIEIMRDPTSLANYFTVTDKANGVIVPVDLMEREIV